MNQRVSQLNGEIRQKDNEIEKLKQEIKSKQSEIEATKIISIITKIGVAASGVVHVIVIIDDIVKRVSLSRAQSQITTLESENADLRGKNHNLEKRVSQLHSEITKLEEELKHLEELRRECQNELAHCRISNEELNKKVEGLTKQNAVIPQLALDQAVLQLLLKTTKYKYSHNRSCIMLLQTASTKTLS